MGNWCSFWEKCLHVQQQGARAVIIYDDNEANDDEWVDMVLESEAGDATPIVIPALFSLGRDGYCRVWSRLLTAQA